MKHIFLVEDDLSLIGGLSFAVIALAILLPAEAFARIFRQNGISVPERVTGIWLIP